MQMKIRPAALSDISIAIPLIYSSGPDNFEYNLTLFKKKAMDFLEYAYADGKGFLGYKNHIIATIDDEAVGIGSFYSGREYGKLARQTTVQILKFYPLRYIPIILYRCWKHTKMMPPPSRQTLFAANLGVKPEKRSLGVCSFMINYNLLRAQELNFLFYALDVSIYNPRAQALYQKLGFIKKYEKKFEGKNGVKLDLVRMEMEIKPAIISE